MDYKYIEQLLERYWRCETSLQEEKILRMFFLQEDIPATLLPYRNLFVYEQNEKDMDILGDDFDQRILGMVQKDEPVKARVITMRHRLMPLFKAAAVVAIFLTLGNAMQVAFSDDDAHQVSPSTAAVEHSQEGPSVAKADSAVSDTLQHKMQLPVSTITK
ncbi:MULTISPECIES: pyruvate ferredoxin oxidoreductase [Prevotella]|uniref:Pyruvate ferredoxin oxidoreductase n=1 Tax=Prevotella melaninogenica TaxID=28132 RepID=A0ABX7XPE1_9BACT|nr:MULTISPECIES: pyruvate ferredoxin oxidoreductase [Prevotella]QUB75413.1 pyruvate ferredoxin oxidoreductase [Prevotella melaninogenica]